jgi:glucokinase
MSANPVHGAEDVPPALGVEIADRATRYTAVLGATPQARRWHARLASPATPSEAVETVAGLVERALHDLDTEQSTQVAETAPHSARLLALGVALADAEVDARHGIVRRLRFVPGWEDAPLAEKLAERIGAGVQLASATNAAAVAEAQLGAGLGYDPILYVSIARNITASLVVGGRYYAGAHGAAGRLGHVLVRPDGPRCACGAYGHLDPIASAQSLVRNLIGRAADSDESAAAMLRVSGGRAEAISAPQVVQLALEGDPAARAVLEEALEALAQALANQIAALDPAAIVLGGPLATAGNGFFGSLAARLDTLCRPFAHLPELRPAALGPIAAVLGARLLASRAGVLQ